MANNICPPIPPIFLRCPDKGINKSGGAGNQPTSEVLPSKEADNIGVEEYQPHPYANMFPMMRDEELADLVASIKEDGQEEPIEMYEGKILDGRNRYAACAEAGFIPKTLKYKGSDPLGFVLRKNLHRRHLTASQRALVASKMADLTNGQRADEVSGTSIDVAAKSLNVGRSSVDRANKVLASGDDELVAAVESGELSVSAASKQVTQASTPGEKVPEGEEQSQKLLKLWDKTGNEGQAIFLDVIGAKIGDPLPDTRRGETG